MRAYQIGWRGSLQGRDAMEAPTPLHLLTVDWETLPKPDDDGAAAHLIGMQLADITLPATDGTTVNLGALPGRGIVYAYPMTGRPGAALPDGWDMIPGARGCTPQACAFRDHYSESKVLGVKFVFGLSTQSTPYQQEAASRLHLQFPLLSDADLRLTSAMPLPTMEVAGNKLLKRLTLIVENGAVRHVFYPVFPPDRSPHAVIAHLKGLME